MKNCFKSREQYAIPIESFQLYKKPISIEKIKKIEPSFHIPQSYLNIKKQKNLYNYLKKQKLYPNEFENNHKNLYMNNLGCSCREMEALTKFKIKDQKYNQNKK